MSQRLRILKETDQYIAVYKPAGMAVQSADLRRMDLMNLMMNEMIRRQRRQMHNATGGKDSAHPYLAVINRLDQPVEGIVLFAKTAGAAARLSEMLQKHHFTKKYLAVVFLDTEASQKEDQWYRLTDYMVRDGRTNKSRIVSAGEPGAQRAELQYRIIRKTAPEHMHRDQDPAYQECIQEDHLQESARSGGAEFCRALLEIDLYTGRHHQIRLQLAHAGMPIAGDRKYGMDADIRGSKDVAGCFPALCAAELAFSDPWTREQVDIRIVPEGRAFSEFGFS
ncbi:MAG: RluA family pseudouridine synthase [Bilifractor sp.]